MPSMIELVPAAPRWEVDWDAVSARFPAVAAMRGTPHDPVHHAEGDPWVHTRFVCEAMAASDDWRDLPEGARASAFAAAVFHDVGKPATAETTPEGRITHHGHSRLGASMAREALWEDGFDPALREAACAAINLHQVPFWLLEREWNAVKRIVVGASLTCGNRVLAALADADARGRSCPDRARMVESVELFRMACEEHGCLDGPFPVPDGATLRAFMASPETVDPSYALPRPQGLPVATLLSGLPGSGKSTWLAREAPGLPVVSLDRIREEMGIPPEKPQGEVVQAAKEEARVHLRARRDFAWDATNLTNDVRGQVLSLFHDYGFSTRVVALEAGPAEIAARFRRRGRSLPDAAVGRMVRKWSYPQPWEADEVVADGWPEPCPTRAAGPRP